MKLKIQVSWLLMKFTVIIIAFICIPNKQLSGIPPDSLNITITVTPVPGDNRWLTSVNTPEFITPTSWAAWQRQRIDIRYKLEKLLGELPPRTQNLDVTILSREETDVYILEKFQFDNGVGAIVPGYLFLPKGSKGKVPAILYCHWHGGQYDIGKQEMLQTNATPVAAGPELARLGYAVLGIDAYCFGERNGQGPDGKNEKGSAGEMSSSKFELWAGRTLWGMILRDDLLALDYLCSRSEIDITRIGVTGISMGSTRSWWLMALDERIKAGVCVACMTRYQDLIRSEKLSAHGIYYFVPGMLRYFDTEAVIALAAPRPILFMTGDKDGGSPIAGVKTISKKVLPIYQLAGKESQFESVIFPDVGHTYLPEMWEQMVKWMDMYVKNN